MPAARTAAAMRRSESDVSWEFRGLGWWCEGDQQVAERGESSPTEVTKGLLRGVGYVAIEATQQGPPRGRDSIGAAPASVGTRMGDNYCSRGVFVKGRGQRNQGVVLLRGRNRRVSISAESAGRSCR